MPTWTHDVSPQSFDSWFSTPEKRIVLRKAKTSIKVIRDASYRVFWPRTYDVLCFVEMTPKSVEVELSGNAVSADGVPVNGLISCQAYVSDDDQKIKRVAADAVSEEDSLRSSILAGVQQAIAQTAWRELLSVGADLRQKLFTQVCSVLADADTCFEIRSLTVKKLVPVKTELAESLERMAQAREEESLRHELAVQRSSRVLLERKSETESLETQLLLERMRKASDLEMERDQIALEKLKREEALAAQRELAELLKTEEGRLAALPSDTFRYLTKELEVKVLEDADRQRLYRDLLRTSQSHKSAKLAMLEAYVAQQFGIKIADDTNVSLPLSDEDANKVDNPQLFEGKREEPKAE